MHKCRRLNAVVCVCVSYEIETKYPIYDVGCVVVILDAMLLYSFMVCGR